MTLELLTAHISGVICSPITQDHFYLLVGEGLSPAPRALTVVATGL